MFITVEIINYKKYNPRKDIENSSWFRMQHNFFENHEFHDFTDEERLFWIYLICCASLKNKGTINLSIGHALEKVFKPQAGQPTSAQTSAQTRPRELREKMLIQALEKLRRLQMVRIRTLRGRYVDVTPTYGYERTNERDVTNEENTRRIEGDPSEDVLQFNLEPEDLPPGKPTARELEAVYQKYPRKEGKKKGMEILKREIKTPEDLALLDKAIEKFRDLMKTQNRPADKVMYFSTFMNSWRDPLDDDYGKNEDFANNATSEQDENFKKHWEELERKQRGETT